MMAIPPPSQLARYTRELSPPAAIMKGNRVASGEQIGAGYGPAAGTAGIAICVFTVFPDVLITVTCGRKFEPVAVRAPDVGVAVAAFATKNCGLPEVSVESPVTINVPSKASPPPAMVRLMPICGAGPVTDDGSNVYRAVPVRG